MHCAQARSLVALLVGDDIGDSDRLEIQRHISECNSCKTYHLELVATQQQLMTVAAESDTRATGLWAELQPQVQLANRNRSTKQFNGWVAALAVAATVMAMFAISGDITPVQSGNLAPQFSPAGLSPVGNSLEPRAKTMLYPSGRMDQRESQRLQDLETF